MVERDGFCISVAIKNWDSCYTNGMARAERAFLSFFCWIILLLHGNLSQISAVIGQIALFALDK